MPALVKRALKTNNDKLERVRRLRAYVVSHFGDVRVVQRRVDLVKDEKRAWLITSDRNTWSTRWCLG
jgi:hypothetical protein